MVCLCLALCLAEIGWPGHTGTSGWGAKREQGAAAQEASGTAWERSKQGWCGSQGPGEGFAWRQQGMP